MVYVIGASMLAHAAAPMSSSPQAETVLADVKAQGARAVVAGLASPRFCCQK